MLSQAKSSICNALSVRVRNYLRSILYIYIYVLILVDVMNVIAESVP